MSFKFTINGRSMTSEEKQLAALAAFGFATCYYEFYLIYKLNQLCKEYGREHERTTKFIKKLAAHVDPGVLNNLIFEHKFEDIVYHEEK